MRNVLGPNTTLGYCTNVHAGTTLDQTLATLREHAVGVRERLGVDELGVGLWLADSALTGVDANSWASFVAELRRLGLLAFTFNAFPFGDFHAAAVKHAVYRPDWCEPPRLAYTQRVAALAAAVGRDTVSVSTLPLGWRGIDRDRAATSLLKTIGELVKLEVTTGCRIHLNLEPEPGCALDTAADVVALFEMLHEQCRGLPIARHLRVCHDVCHTAVMGEDQADVLRTYRDAGIKVGKVQVSNAVEVDFDAMQPSERGGALAELAAFAEDRYLHQTMIRTDDGTQTFHDDLPLALRAAEQTGEARGRWRVHFHVPLHVDRFGRIETTQREIGACLDAIEPGDGVEHFEAETYAWGVLPEAMRVDTLAQGIAAELRWLVGTHGR